MAPSVSAVQLTGFHLHDGDKVRVEVTATNNVDDSVHATSDGVTIDLTDPVLVALVDGDTVDTDLQSTVNEKIHFACLARMCNEIKQDGRQQSSNIVTCGQENI